MDLTVIGSLISVNGISGKVGKKRIYFSTIKKHQQSKNMKKIKETNIALTVFGLLLSLLFVATIIWIALESLHDSDDPSDIVRKMYIAGGAGVLLGVFFLFAWWFEKTRISNFEKKMETELGLKPISKMELFSKHINRHRYYGQWDYPGGYIRPIHRFHGEYKGYEICIIDDCPAPHFYSWSFNRYPWTPAVHIKSDSFNFPKFLIRNKWLHKFWVTGDQKAQMWFDKPYILDFFNQCRIFAAQGNGNGFILHQIDGEKGNYKLLLKHAFIVLELLSKAAPYSSVSEIGKLQEKCKRAHKKNVLWWPCLLIAAVATPIFVYLLFFK